MALRAESLWAMTEPAEPPPTMIVSYTLAFPLVVGTEKLAHIRHPVTTTVKGVRPLFRFYHI